MQAAFCTVGRRAGMEPALLTPLEELDTITGVASGSPRETDYGGARPRDVNCYV